MFTLAYEEGALEDQPGWPVQISATYTDGGAPAPVFVYHTAASPLAGRDFFSCVASAAQMTELPAGSGSAGHPFYRVSSLVKRCRDERHVREFREKVARAVQDLANNLTLAAAIVETESVTITAI